MFGDGRARFAAHDAGSESLSAARDAFSATGQAEEAATAETMLGEVAWIQGRPAATIPHVERAAAMVANRPASYAKAYVHANLTRFLMLAGREAEAVRVGREALGLAEEAGGEEVVAAVLNSLGTARLGTGDDGGLVDLERSIEIAEHIASPEAIRGHINLASMTQVRGDIRRGAELHRRGLELARRFGQTRGIRFLTAEHAFDDAFLGDWDAALEGVEAFIAEVEVGSPHYMECGCRSVRATIAVARGDDGLALRDAERSLAQARELEEPQVLLPALAGAAAVFAEAGHGDRARQLVEELLGSAEAVRRADFWVVPGVIPTERLGLAPRLVSTLEAHPSPSPWVRAALLYARSSFSEAADVLHEIGHLPAEAQARLRAAETLAADGRPPEAHVELARATAFFRSVQATRYLRRADAVLAEAS